jgi:hypothetical protein
MHASALILSVILAAGQGAVVPEQLVIAATVTDRHDEPLAGVKPEEFELRENGKSRPLLRVERDQRPLSVALVVDSSAAMGMAYTTDVIPAVRALLDRLPEGTRFTVWTTGDRPTQVVPFGSTPAQGEALMRNVSAGQVNAAIDTINEAARAFEHEQARRTAVIVLTTAGPGEANPGLESPRASLRPTYLALTVDLGPKNNQLDAMLTFLVERTAGVHHHVFSISSIATRYAKLLDFLDAQYRLAWQPAVDPRGARLEVRVRRKDTKVVQAQRLATAW